LTNRSFLHGPALAKISDEVATSNRKVPRTLKTLFKKISDRFEISIPEIAAKEDKKCI
jgi:hypothetical protein